MKLAHLMQLKARVEAPIPIGKVLTGNRMIYNVASGEFEGDRLRGQVLPGGGEWFLQNDEGMGQPDVRILLQTDDGGWSWLGDEQSNAFSTGQTVYALATVGDERTREALQRGVDYLLENQQADGTWQTPSNLTSTEPTEEKDYIYRYWGTAWASMGLSRASSLDPAAPRLGYLASRE